MGRFLSTFQFFVIKPRKPTEEHVLLEFFWCLVPCEFNNFFRLSTFYFRLKMVINFNFVRHTNHKTDWRTSGFGIFCIRGDQDQNRRTGRPGRYHHRAGKAAIQPAKVSSSLQSIHPTGWACQKISPMCDNFFRLWTFYFRLKMVMNLIFSTDWLKINMCFWNFFVPSPVCGLISFDF